MYLGSSIIKDISKYLEPEILSYFNRDQSIINEYASYQDNFKTFNNEYDIIIIGAGISGLYLGYKAVKNKTDKSILIVESSSRVGGRITSAKINDNTSYQVEGCAQRFYESSDLLIKLLKELDIEYVSERYTNIRTNKNYFEIVKDIIEKDSNNSDNPELTFSNVVYKHTKDNYIVDKISNEFGFSFLKHPINYPLILNFFTTFFLYELKYQYMVKEGFMSLITKLYNIVSEFCKIKLSYDVNKINYENGYYIVNDLLKCKKIIFTGTRNHLCQINTNIDFMNETKRLLNENYLNMSSIKIFIKFNKPWWTENELFYRFNSGNIISQLWYYTIDTIQVYSSMEKADFIYNMMSYEIRDTNNPNTNIRWFDHRLYGKEFIDMIKLEIKRLIEYTKKDKVPTEIEIESINQIAFRYTSVASQYLKPIKKELYDDFFKRLNKHNNFYMIGGDYTKIPGWVNSCLQCVEDYYKDILS
jgi:hypothetical protein